MPRLPRVELLDDGVIVPADPWSAEYFRANMETGRFYAIDLKNTRKLGTLGDWWAGLGYMVMYWEGTGDPRFKLYPSSAKLNEAVLIWLGFSEPWYHLDGSVSIRADSVSFEAIREESAFKEIFERARVMALEKWGIDPWDEWKKAKERAGGRSDWRRNWRPSDED